MAFFSKKKRLFFILASCLALAVTGTSTFAVMEPLLSGEFSACAPISDASFTPINGFFDCVLGGGAVIDRAGERSFSPMRDGSLRVSIALGAQNGGSAFSRLSLKTIEKTNPPNIKNTILLKLRI
jgi:hypothetical protein